MSHLYLRGAAVGNRLQDSREAGIVECALSAGGRAAVSGHGGRTAAEVAHVSLAPFPSLVRDGYATGVVGPARLDLPAWCRRDMTL